MPPLREDDRYFWGCAYWRSNYFLLSSRIQEQSSRMDSGIQLKDRETWYLIPLNQQAHSRLIHKAAHSDIHHHPQRQEHKQHGRPSVTH
jgi:hypothetical protein